MPLNWSLTFLVASVCLVQVQQVRSRPEMTTAPPKVVQREAEELPPQPMTYQFIVDHRPTSLGQNYYIKPGQLVGMFSVDSGRLHVRSDDPKRNVASKLNILFVATTQTATEAATATAHPDQTTPETITMMDSPQA